MSVNRDPEYMRQMLKRIESAWHCHPELRLGQLLGNSFPPGIHDPFYIEDDHLVRGVEKYVKSTEGK